jgi:prepilin-type processing-associated H-X9-DG protein
MLLPQLELQTLYDQIGWQMGAFLPADCGVGPSMTNWRSTIPDVANVLRTRPAVMVCPSSVGAKSVGEWATGSYALSHGSNGPTQGIGANVKVNNGIFGYIEARAISDVLDGLSNTFLAGEVYGFDFAGGENRWMIAGRHVDSLRSTDNPLNTLPGTGVLYDTANGAFGSYHPGGAQFAMADGSTRFVADSVALAVYRAASTRAGRESTQLP